ncbi:hypothetical protein GCK72_016352 [Caenorhabditis remanei]|uniref:G-protein coupled receptors family 1 profile domain-containing protein n=2 Tax=Caenorhabditis remanei TaxID=31234 RepID=E3N5X1_CAERE|nr:hypothetical protein GCK72_016352 [Caenorhabditis remanei]EFO87371.1 hypothetical protein CRE_31400 [Caenorhabditis remanei]KAF1759885.1 hypothetical protein GCK72_016352 [Caenorhabditis remanei]
MGFFDAAVNITMLTYISLGLPTVVFNIPFVHLTLFIAKNRGRKEFVTLGCSALGDIIYVVIYVFNSFWRIQEHPTMVSRAECISHINILISTFTAVLIFVNPLMIAIDRLVVSVSGVWYYKQTLTYTVVLFSIPIVISSIVAGANVYMTSISPVEMISSMCFTSGIIQTGGFEWFYYGFKWSCVVLALVVYGVVAIVYWKKVQIGKCDVVNRVRIQSAYLVMAFNTANCILFLFVPDVLLKFLIKKSLALMTCLFSFMIIKLLLNLAGIMLLHKELRTAYLDKVLIFPSWKKRVFGFTSVVSVSNHAQKNRMTAPN